MNIQRPRTSLSLLPLLLTSAALGTACSSDATPADSASNGGVDEIVYAVRQHTTVDDDGKVQVDVAGGMGQVMDYRRYVPGARIEVRNLATGATRNIIEGDEYALADVVGIDVSFDAKELAFSMRRGGDDQHYHVYVANLGRQTITRAKL